MSNKISEYISNEKDFSRFKMETLENLLLNTKID